MGPNASATSEESTVLKLKGKGLESIPEQYSLSQMIKTVDLSDNKIKSLPSGLEIKSLNLANNHLKEIPIQVFTYLCLTTLDISGNSLKELPSDIKKLQSLHTFNLSRNSICSFDAEIPSLQKLKISSNQLKDLPPMQPSIKMIDINFNQIKKILGTSEKLQKFFVNLCSVEVFSKNCYFPSLVEISFAMNKIKKLPNLSSICPNLETADFSDNLIKIFPTFPASIKKISLQRNQIIIFKQPINHLSKLKYLDVSFNLITSFPECPHSLRFLDARENPLTDFLSSPQTAIHHLLISKCDLFKIPSFINSSMKTLIFSNCCITRLNMKSFGSSLNTIELPFNKITSLPDEIFLNNNLQTLVVNSNLITSISSKISDSKLTKLNVSNNPLTSFPSLLPKTLQYLSCGYCGIQSLPEGMDSLQILVAPGNQLKSIPTLKNVSRLFVPSNQIRKWPHLPTCVVKIDISFNPVKKIGRDCVYPNLIELDFSHTQIKKIRPNFSASQLLYLRISYTPILGEIDLSKFPSLLRLDAVGCSLNFPEEPQTREIIVTSKSKNPHFRQMNHSPYFSYAESVGPRETMEDCIVCRYSRKNKTYLFAVCDGHGGINSSLFIGRAVVDLLSSIQQEDILKNLNKINDLLKEKEFVDGTTITLAMVKGRNLVIVNLGDSRTILLEKNGNVSFQTIDHKLTNRDEFESVLSRKGEVVEERLFGRLAVSRAFGDKDVPCVSSTPDITEITLKDESKWLLLCCDGVTDVVSTEELSKIMLEEGMTPELAAERIKNLANMYNTEDNVSVLVADLEQMIINSENVASSKVDGVDEEDYSSEAEEEEQDEGVLYKERYDEKFLTIIDGDQDSFSHSGDLL